MKRIISLALIVAVLAAFSSVTAAKLPGDCNGDGAVDNKDVVVLFRYVSSGEEVEAEENCDFNNDGAIDNKDVVSLFRYVSGGSAGETGDTEDTGEIIEKDLYIFEDLISLEKPEGYTFYDSYLGSGIESGVKDGVPDGTCFFNFMLQGNYSVMTESDITPFLDATRNNFNNAFGPYTVDGFESYVVKDCPVTKLDWTWENGIKQSLVRIHFDGATVVIQFAAWADVPEGIDEFNDMIQTLDIIYEE